MKKLIPSVGFFETYADVKTSIGVLIGSIIERVATEKCSKMTCFMCKSAKRGGIKFGDIRGEESCPLLVVRRAVNDGYFTLDILNPAICPARTATDSCSDCPHSMFIPEEDRNVCILTVLWNQTHDFDTDVAFDNLVKYSSRLREIMV